MEWWIGYAAIGVVAGFFAGMFGIGGGVIIVPLLVMLFDAQGLPKAHILHLAVGTGMATILFTSVSSVRAHASRGALRWDIARSITPGILLGGIAGALAAGRFSRFGFALFFTVFIFLAATNMFLNRPPKPSRQLPDAPGMFGAGVAIGVLSALAAIGGGAVTVPFLLYCNVPMLQAIGTAAVIGFPVALGGSIGYIVSGLSAQGLPGQTLGYIYLPALAGITIASVLTAPIGAAVAHRLPTGILKRVFAVLLYFLAIRMLMALW